MPTEIPHPLWAPDQRPRRGPKPSLSVTRITRTALEIADAEGLGAVSMTRIAATLGVTTMALYRYVSSKDDVLALMADAAVPVPGEVLDKVADGWRAGLDSWVMTQITLLQERPWMLDIPLTTSETGPNRLGWIDWAVGRLEGTRLTAAEKLAVAGVLAAFALAEARLGAEEAAAAGKVPDIVATIIERGDPARYPHLAAAFAGMESADPPAGVLDVYDEWFGVRTVLDGIAAFIDRMEKERSGAV